MLLFSLARFVVFFPIYRHTHPICTAVLVHTRTYSRLWEWTKGEQTVYRMQHHPRRGNMQTENAANQHWNTNEFHNHGNGMWIKVNSPFLNILLFYPTVFWPHSHTIGISDTYIVKKASTLPAIWHLSQVFWKMKPNPSFIWLWHRIKCTIIVICIAFKGFKGFTSNNNNNNKGPPNLTFCLFIEPFTWNLAEICFKCLPIERWFRI